MDEMRRRNRDRPHIGKPGLPADRLIRRKIVPPDLPTTVVPRERVESLFARLVEQNRLVVVYASAGAGKTTAVRQAAQRLDRPLAWLDLDITDVATGRLLIYLEAALTRQVPELAGITASGFAAQLAHPEIAGLLADALADSQVLVVLDNAERLSGSPEALAVVGAFARYLPQSARLLLLSRTELSFDTTIGISPWVAAVGEHDLALTVDEAAVVLSLAGRNQVDPNEAVRQTGGWMTGVLFEAWRSADHVLGIGGESDPLHGYLAAEILSQLGHADREFLITTAVLAEVSVATASALAAPGASTRMHSLLGRRMPVSWSDDATVMRCHPRFREFLLKLLGRRDPGEQRELHRGHAAILAAEGHHEEAIEEYLRAESPAEALTMMAPILERVIERTDFAVAERWLEQVAAIRDADDLALVGAELLMAVAREDFGAGVEVADALQAKGLRDELAHSSGRAASLMAWCYLHVGRREAIDEVLAAARQGEEVQAAHYTMTLVRDDPTIRADVSVALNGGPLEAMLMRAHFDLGRLSLLTAPPTSPWAAQVGESWLAGALLSSGDVERALELYHRLSASSGQSVWLTALLGPKLMMEISEPAAAWRLLREGRIRIEATGSQLFEMYSLLLEAELELRGQRDVARARAVLDRVHSHPIGQQYAFVREQWQMLTGLADLLEGFDASAYERLDAAVRGMRAGNRLLFLAPAAVYLAEACWRTGAEEAADEAADLALVAAGRQGSNHTLLEALAGFPDVLSRRIDLEPTADSAWHDLGRSLLVRGVQLADVVGASVHLTEFGQLTILVNGVEVAPRLNKSVELLAFLSTREGHEAPKHTLLEQLFDGRKDESSSSYLRQAIFRLRKVIPEIFDPDAPSGLLRLGSEIRVTTESQRVLGLLSQAAGMRGEQKLRALLDAIEIAERGEYLPGTRSEWVERRRQELEPLLSDARCEAAEVALAAGRYRQADRLAEIVLRADRYQERAWRLRMRVAHAHGDQQRVLTAYRACEQALSELGAQPSSATVALLHDLRR
jgi:DNA-binding SARP family transcriptional activator